MKINFLQLDKRAQSWAKINFPSFLWRHSSRYHLDHINFFPKIESKPTISFIKLKTILWLFSEKKEFDLENEIKWKLKNFGIFVRYFTKFKNFSTRNKKLIKTGHISFSFVPNSMVGALSGTKESRVIPSWEKLGKWGKLGKNQKCIMFTSH